tara:strand:+ start:261 stop:644 length:384 start_codon:yes stop_codon:yes gene_type:complete
MPTPFKMKGSPMQRNFGTPSPAKQIVPVIKAGIKVAGKVYSKVKKVLSKRQDKKLMDRYVKDNNSTYYNPRTKAYQSHPGLSGNKNYNPFTDPNKAKKTFMSNPTIDPKIRTDYSNKFIKAGKLNIK